MIQYIYDISIQYIYDTIYLQGEYSEAGYKKTYSTIYSLKRIHVARWTRSTIEPNKSRVQPHA